MQVLIPPDLIWWEATTSAQEVTDDLELGPGVHPWFDTPWTHVQGVGWVDQPPQ